jgi:hypothetical protein
MTEGPRLSRAEASKSSTLAVDVPARALDEGLPSLCLPRSRLYGESLYMQHTPGPNGSAPSYVPARASPGSARRGSVLQPVRQPPATCRTAAVRAARPRARHVCKRRGAAG